ALMGANMQRQAVPLVRSEAPYVGTGMEQRAAYDAGDLIITPKAGVVENVTADLITIMDDEGQRDTYMLRKFERTNQNTNYNQTPLVSLGERVEAGQVLADGPGTHNGEMSLGRNLLVAFMPWEGHNYEDAIILNQRIVEEDILTSIHIEEHEIDARDTKLGPEEITREIPNVSDDVLRDLDERGIVRIGADVRAGDILVGKVTPKGETELTPEERLLRAIFGEKAREVRDTSMKVPHGETGKVIGVSRFSREDDDDLAPGVNEMIRVYVAQKRKIQDGDKLAGRHGNKGVVGKILPPEDMPFMEDGTPVDIILNTHGVPRRMNIGQVLEVHLGWLAHAGWKIDTEDPANAELLKTLPEELYDVPPESLTATPVFDGATNEEISRLLASSKPNRDGDVMVDEHGKARLFDGRHASHYGRMCPIETPEGPNIGLIGSLASYARVNAFGFIETPYRKVVDGKVTDQVEYLTADEEDRYAIAQAEVEKDADGTLTGDRIEVRLKDGDIGVTDASGVDYVDVSPRQMVSVATAMIPFLEHDDAN
ncbi:hypothetical protein ACGLFO_07735, partial [Corynebacterium hesseae]